MGCAPSVLDDDASTKPELLPEANGTDAPQDVSPIRIFEVDPVKVEELTEGEVTNDDGDNDPFPLLNEALEKQSNSSQDGKSSTRRSSGTRVSSSSTVRRKSSASLTHSGKEIHIPGAVPVEDDSHSNFDKPVSPRVRGSGSASKNGRIPSSRSNSTKSVKSPSMHSISSLNIVDTQNLGRKDEISEPLLHDNEPLDATSLNTNLNGKTSVEKNYMTSNQFVKCDDANENNVSGGAFDGSLDELPRDYSLSLEGKMDILDDDRLFEGSAKKYMISNQTVQSVDIVESNVSGGKMDVLDDDHYEILKGGIQDNANVTEKMMEAGNSNLSHKNQLASSEETSITSEAITEEASNERDRDMTGKRVAFRGEQLRMEEHQFIEAETGRHLNYSNEENENKLLSETPDQSKRLIAEVTSETEHLSTEEYTPYSENLSKPIPQTHPLDKVIPENEHVSDEFTTKGESQAELPEAQLSTEGALPEADRAAEGAPSEAEVATEEAITETEQATEKTLPEADLVTEEAPVGSELTAEEMPAETELATELVPPEAELANKEALPEAELDTEETPPEAEQANEEVLPEAELDTEETLPEAELANKEALPEAELDTEETPPEAEQANEEVLPEAELDTEETLPEAELANKEALPEAELDTEETPPEAEQANEEVLPEAELDTEETLPEAELANKEALPEAELDTEETLPEAELANKGTLPEAELDTEETLPEAELVNKEALPEAELDTKETLPEAEQANEEILPAAELAIEKASDSVEVVEEDLQLPTEPLASDDSTAAALDGGEVPSEHPSVETTKMANSLGESASPTRRYSLGTDNEEEEELQHKTRRATLSKTSLITQPEVPSVAVSISDLLSESDFNCDEVDSCLTSSAAAMLAFPTRSATAKYRKMHAFDSVAGDHGGQVIVNRREKRSRSSTLSTDNSVYPSSCPTSDIVDDKSHLEEIATDVMSQLDTDVFDFKKIEENGQCVNITEDIFASSEVETGESYLLPESEITQEMYDNNDVKHSCKVHDITETEKINDFINNDNVESLHTEDVVGIDVKTDEIKCNEGGSMREGSKLESDVALQNDGVKTTSLEIYETNTVTKEMHDKHQILEGNNEAEVTSVDVISFNGKLNNNEIVTEKINVNDVYLADISSQVRLGSLSDERKNEVEPERSIHNSNFANENANEIDDSKEGNECYEISENESDDVLIVDNINVESSSDATEVTNVDEDAELNQLPDKIIGKDLGLVSQTEVVYGEVDDGPIGEADRPIKDGEHEIINENYYFSKTAPLLSDLSLLSGMDEESGPVSSDKQMDPLVAETNNGFVNTDVNLTLNCNTDNKMVTVKKGAGACPAEVGKPEREVINTEETQQNNAEDSNLSLQELPLHEVNCDNKILANGVVDPEPSDQQQENVINTRGNMCLNSSTPRQEDLQHEAVNEDTRETSADKLTKEPEAIEGNPDTGAGNITEKMEPNEDNREISSVGNTEEPRVSKHTRDTGVDKIKEEREVNEDTQHNSAMNITEETEVVGENELDYGQTNNQEETEGDGYNNDSEEAARNELNNYITQQYSRSSTPLDDPASIADHAPVLAIPRTPTLINEMLESVS